jgi:L-alanine-DL-glutamate epimerase-like enolase superfamily enzyme
MIPITNGTMKVPELPGLGVMVDEEKIKRYETNNPS